MDNWQETMRYRSCQLKKTLCLCASVFNKFTRVSDTFE